MLLPSPVASAATVSQSSETVVIVVGGDLGLGGSRQPISDEGGYRHGRRHRWAELTRGIAPLIDGDINFANLETVVSDRHRLRPVAKAYNFKMHPAGVRHLVEVGFNVFSTANNHAIDYGRAGMHETLRHLSALRPHGLAGAPGLGVGRSQASEPSIVHVKGHDIAVSALGIGGGGPLRSATRVGMMSYNATTDFDATIEQLAVAPAAYRMLSVHYGGELQIHPSQSAVAKLRDQAAVAAGIDLVVGHHAHVAAGVQLIDGRLIFYGLGNLLHLGMQNMSKFGPCRDFGLLGRIHLTPGDDGRLVARAVEVVPLVDMHRHSRPMDAARAHTRIAVLNDLATGLDDMPSGATGLRFVAQADGSGLHCLFGARDLPGRIGERCRAAPPRISSAVIATHACRRRTRHAARARSRRRTVRRSPAIPSAPVVQGPIYFDGFFGSAYDG